MAILLMLTGCPESAPNDAPNGKPLRVEMTIRAMGIRPELKVYAPNRETGVLWLEKGAGAIHQIDVLMSTYKPDSELSRLSTAEANVWHPISRELMEVLKLSRRLSKESGGRFDVTVRPLIQLWRKAAKEERLPTEEQVAAARRRVGQDAVELDDSKLRIRLKKTGMSIDLGAVAKGYAVDEAVVAMKKAGATAGLVEAGGDLFAFGTKPGGKRWTAAIRNPRVPEGKHSTATEPAMLTILRISNMAVVTSGHYERFSEIEGKRYSHIIDPRTGKPVDQRLASVTIVAPTCTLADGLATAVAVMGAKEGMRLIERQDNVEALIYMDDGPGKPLRPIRSTGLAAMEADEISRAYASKFFAGRAGHSERVAAKRRKTPPCPHPQNQVASGYDEPIEAHLHSRRLSNTVRNTSCSGYPLARCTTIQLRPAPTRPPLFFYVAHLPACRVPRAACETAGFGGR